MSDTLTHVELANPAPTINDSPDGIDFYWWSDDDIMNLIFDSEKFMALDENTMYDLVWQLGKRYQQALDNSDD